MGGPRVNLDPNKIVELYEKHQSVRKVGKELGCTGETIRTEMHKLGLSINKPILYSCNESFFNEDNEKSFYWAGFLAADGCIVEKDNSLILSMGLSTKDRLHLEKFKSDLNAEHPIHEFVIKNSKRNSNWNDGYKAEIQICNTPICKSLERFNVFPRKTKTYTFPSWLIFNEHVNHFMRGYFDGDGSWFIGASKKTDQLFFSLRGTKDFLVLYRSILENKCNLKQKTKPIRINCNIGVLEYGGNGISVKIRDFLYKNATVFLERKYDLVKDISPWVPKYKRNMEIQAL